MSVVRLRDRDCANAENEQDGAHLSHAILQIAYLNGRATFQGGMKRSSDDRHPKVANSLVKPRPGGK